MSYGGARSRDDQNNDNTSQRGGRRVEEVIVSEDFSLPPRHHQASSSSGVRRTLKDIVGVRGNTSVRKAKGPPSVGGMALQPGGSVPPPTYDNERSAVRNDATDNVEDTLKRYSEGESDDMNNPSVARALGRLRVAAGGGRGGVTPTPGSVAYEKFQRDFLRDEPTSNGRDSSNKAAMDALMKLVANPSNSLPTGETSTAVVFQRQCLLLLSNVDECVQDVHLWNIFASFGVIPARTSRGFEACAMPTSTQVSEGISSGSSCLERKTQDRRLLRSILVAERNAKKNEECKQRAAMEAAATVSAQLAAGDSFVEDSSAIHQHAEKEEASAEVINNPPANMHEDDEDIGLTSAEKALACQHESELVRLWGQPLPDSRLFVPDGNMQFNSNGPSDALMNATMNAARGMIESANPTTGSMNLLRNARSSSEADRVVLVQLRRRGDLVESVKYLNGAVINGRRVKASLLGY